MIQRRRKNPGENIHTETAANLILMSYPYDESHEPD